MCQLVSIMIPAYFISLAFIIVMFSFLLSKGQIISGYLIESPTCLEQILLTMLVDYAGRLIKRY